MQFFSYDYVLSRISTFNWILALSLVLLTILFLYFIFKYYKENRDTKYRELVIILALNMITTLLIGASQLKLTQASNNQYRESLAFIETVSDQLGVDEHSVYVNTSAATDGAILYVNGQFYRAIRAQNTSDGYLLEILTLLPTDIDLVEVDTP